MKINSEQLIELGFIQDENFPALFTFKESPLEFLLQDEILLAGQDLAGEENTHSVFFKIKTLDKVNGFLDAVTIDEYQDFFNAKLKDHAES